MTVAMYRSQQLGRRSQSIIQETWEDKARKRDRVNLAVFFLGKRI